MVSLWFQISLFPRIENSRMLVRFFFILSWRCAPRVSITRMSIEHNTANTKRDRWRKISWPTSHLILWMQQQRKKEHFSLRLFSYYIWDWKWKFPHFRIELIKWWMRKYNFPYNWNCGTRICTVWSFRTYKLQLFCTYMRMFVLLLSLGRCSLWQFFRAFIYYKFAWITQYAGRLAIQ